MRLAVVAAALLALLAPAPGSAQDAAKHGLSLFGDLKYPADFKHFDYVNPDAPKGGTVKLATFGTRNTLLGLNMRLDGSARVLPAGNDHRAVCFR